MAIVFRKGLFMNFSKKILIVLSALFIFHQSIHAAPATKCAAATATKEATQWQTYTYQDNHFSIDLPAKPDHVRQKIEIPKSTVKIEYDTYVSEPSDDVVYVISVWNYPSEIDMSHPETNLKDGFQGMLSALQGSKVISSDITDVQGFKALEFLVKNEDVFFQGKLVIVHNTLFQVFSVYREKTDMTKSYDKFINSFKIINPDGLKTDKNKNESVKNGHINV